jgi:hypothetical protein
MPREHGAYAQLAFPLLSGLILGRSTLAACALATGAVVLFLCYEPLAVRLGIRGSRLQRAEGDAARLQLAVLAPAALLLGSVGLASASPTARLLATVPVGLVALLIPLVRTRRVKTLLGETLVVSALASVHLPLAAAGGVSGMALWAPAFVWLAGFFLATLAVHAIKARHKQRDPWIERVALAASGAGVLAALALVVAGPPLRLLGMIGAWPLLAVLAVNVVRVHPRALKRVGWTLVAANTAALVLLTRL